MRVVLEKGAHMPTYAHDTDAGMDLRCRESFDIKGHSYVSVDTGIHVEIPQGYVGFIKSKSGLSTKNSIEHGAGVVDCGYTGSLVVKLYNHSDTLKHFDGGDKIAQLVVLPINHVSLELVDSLEETERGNSGFGSTGK